MSKAKVLVVDDVQANIVLMKAILTSQEFDVATAMTGLNIIEVIEKENPDIVLLDIMMAGMDGYEVLRCIRSNEPSKTLPVVMVSALGEPEQIEKAYEIGANGFITKPIFIPQLVKVIEEQIALIKKA